MPIKHHEAWKAASRLAGDAANAIEDLYEAEKDVPHAMHAELVRLEEDAAHKFRSMTARSPVLR